MLETGNGTLHYNHPRSANLAELTLSRGPLLTALATEMHEILECREENRWKQLGEFLGKLETQYLGRLASEEIAGIVSAVRGSTGASALHYITVESGPVELIPRLIRLGADPNIISTIDLDRAPGQLYSPLHCASTMDDDVRFRALVLGGADTLLKTSRHTDAVEIAVNRNNWKIVETAITEGKWLNVPSHSHLIAAGKVYSVPCLAYCRAKRWDDARELFKSAGRVAAAVPGIREQLLDMGHRDFTGERTPPVLHQLIAFGAPIELIRQWLDLKPDLQKVAYLPPEYGAGVPAANPLHLAIRKDRADAVNLLLERGVKLLEYGTNGKPIRILPSVLAHGSEEIKKRAIGELLEEGALHVIEKDILPGLISGGRWADVAAYIDRGVPAPVLPARSKDELFEFLQNTLHTLVTGGPHWHLVSKFLDSMPAYEKLYGGPIASAVLWNEPRNGQGIGISKLLTFGAPAGLIERAMAVAPVNRNKNGTLSYAWKESSPNPICAALRGADEERLSMVLKGNFELGSMTQQNAHSNPLVACLKDPPGRAPLLPKLLEFVEQRGVTQPKEAALILLGGLGFAESAQSQKQIIDSMRNIRAALPAAAADTGVLEIRPEHAMLSPSEIKHAAIGKFVAGGERWRIFQKRYSISDAIAYTQAFEDVQSPIKMPPGVPGPFLRLLPRIHEKLEDYTELLGVAGGSRLRESELFALLANNAFDTRRHLDHQPGVARILYGAIGSSTGTGSPSPEAATIFKHIGALSFAFQRWNFDTKSIKDPDGSRITPCLIEQYGLKPVKGVYSEQLGFGFELPPELKNFTTWITTAEGKRREQRFDPNFHLVLRRSYLLASHPDWGRIIVPNPVLTSGREVFPRGAYWSAEHSPSDLTERDFILKEGGKLELRNHFSPLTLPDPEENSGRRRAWIHGREEKMLFEMQAAGRLVDALRAWSEEYQGWKFDTRFETAWDGKQLLGGPRSAGFKAVVEQMEYMLLAMQTKSIPFTSMQLIISPPDRPTYLQIPFPGLDGKPEYGLRVTEDVIAEMRRGSQSGLEMEGAYSLFNTALKSSGDLTVLLRR